MRLIPKLSPLGKDLVKIEAGGCPDCGDTPFTPCPTCSFRWRDELAEARAALVEATQELCKRPTLERCAELERIERTVKAWADSGPECLIGPARTARKMLRGEMPPPPVGPLPGRLP
jgi:hypothetical protein